MGAGPRGRRDDGHRPLTLSIPSLDPALPGLCIAQPALAEPFLLEGERVRFIGSQTRSGGQALFRDAGGSAGMTAGIRPDTLGHAANLVLYPGVSRRDFTGSRGSAVESVVAARTLPFLAWQLSGSAADEARIHLDLATPSPSPVIEAHADGLVLIADDQKLRLQITPAPAEIEVVDSGGGVTASITLIGDTTHTLVLASGTPSETESAIRAARHLSGHALRATQAAEHTLRAVTGVDAVDDGLAWALSRSGGLVAERPAAALSLGLAAIALGHRSAAEAALSSLRASDLVGAGILAARIGSTTGDTGPPADIAARLLVDGSALDDERLGLTARSLADALQYGATSEVLAALRALGAEARHSNDFTSTTSSATATTSATGGVSLPMAGGSNTQTPVDGSASSWLRGLLSGDPGAPALVEDVRSSRARRAASAFRSDPDRAWADWRAVLDEGLVRGPAGPATWDDLTALPALHDQNLDRPAATGELILAFVNGMLGLSPDAPVGRLRLAPRMPEHLTRFAVEGIPIGEGTIRMAYERSGAEVLFTLEPERIGVPPLLVFEPSVSGEARSVTVDGAAAELDLRSDMGRTVVPVQLPLDSLRTVRITSG